MADDDDVERGTSPDPTPAAWAPRRSTFTPPEGVEMHDDDELANALAADLDRIASGPIPIVQPGWRPAEPVGQEPEPVAEEPEPEPVAEVPEPVAEEPEADAGAEEPEPDATTPELPPPTGPAIETVPPPWSSLPAPDPSQAVSLPEGPPLRPVRRSVPDEELSTWVDGAGREPGGTLSVIENLEAQLRLREEETREFQAWENRMLALGTPEAAAAVEQARPEFTGLLPSAPVPAGAETAPETGSFILPEAPRAEWPPPRLDGEAYVEPVDETDGETEVESDGEPEGETDGVAVDEPDGAPADDEAGDERTDDAERDETEHDDEAQPAVHDDEQQAPPPSLPEWAIPGAALSPEPDGDSVAEPQSKPVDDESEPEQAASTTSTVWDLDSNDTGAEVEPEPEVEVEPEPEVVESEQGTSEQVTAEQDAPADEPPAHEQPADEQPADEQPADEIELEAEPDAGHEEPPASAPPFSPPPLVEPPLFGGPPILPSQAKSRPLVPDEEPPLRADPEPQTEADSTAEVMFIEPLPVAAGEPAPLDTGSIMLIDHSYENELDDDVDETDRAFDGRITGPVTVDTSGIAIVPPALAAPSGPIATVRVPDDEIVLIDNEPIRQRVFSLEESGLEPTPVDHRVGRAARLFWLWFAANSSVLSLGLGAAIFAVGMSLRQSIVAVLAGVALSFIPLGLSTLAGKRSGQPTMVVSRATFGLVGNVVPAVLALVTRLFWGAVLLWLLASSVSIIIVGAGLNGALGDRQLLLISLAVAFLLALLVAFAGYPLIARIQLILSIISGVLVIGLIALTAQYIDIPQALTVQDGPWLLAVTGAVLVFSFVGLVWATSGADLARYQRPGTSGASSMLWATFGTTLPSFLLIAYGALLAASNEGIASGFLLSPLDTLTLMLPGWYPVPLIAATALSLLSGIIISLYSGGFALQSIGVRVPRQWSIVIVGIALGLLALVLTFGVTGGINELFRDVATTLAVPTAAWAGIFAAETMIRNRRFESQSLLTRGGVYPDVRWANLIGLVLITVVGFALTSATVTWLSWQGYGFALFGVPLDSDLAATDVGVLVALVLGLLTPIASGIPAIRRQESTVV